MIAVVGKQNRGPRGPRFLIQTACCSREPSGETRSLEDVCCLHGNVYRLLSCTEGLFHTGQHNVDEDQSIDYDGNYERICIPKFVDDERYEI